MSRPIVIIESPYAGDVLTNVAFARLAVADSLKRGEAPYASHLLYTQPGILDDDDPEERKLGIEAGWTFMQAASKVAVYVTGNEMSEGMRAGIDRARALGLPVEERRLTDCLTDDAEAAFPPGSSEEHDPDLLERGRLVRDIQLLALRTLPLSARSALDALAETIERGDL